MLVSKTGYVGEPVAPFCDHEQRDARPAERTGQQLLLRVGERLKQQRRRQAARATRQKWPRNAADDCRSIMAVGDGLAKLSAMKLTWTLQGYAALLIGRLDPLAKFSPSARRRGPQCEGGDVGKSAANRYAE